MNTNDRECDVIKTWSKFAILKRSNKIIFKY